jgi:mono/diheme cytochrome c family protein
VSGGRVGRVARIALVLGVGVVLGGCPRGQKAEAEAGASADASADASTSTAAGAGRELVVGACLSCHSEHMLAQQRLTPAQWAKVVTKMVGWGANLEPAEVGPIVSYLSASYGPDGGVYELESMPAADAPAELAPASDEAFPPGDATRGRPLYVEKCSGCHGAEARGHIGVALIDRPFLYRPADVARTVRRGRGKMLPIPLSDAEIADVLAHLRALRNPLP